MHFLNKNCVVTTLGFGLVSLGVILAIFWMDIFRSILATELALAPDTKSYKLWKNPPFPLNFDVYLFNWTNPRNLTADDYEKPILEQIGPYRFREKPFKTKVKWHPHNSTISYRRRSTYHFVPEESAGRLDDVITTINSVAVSAAHTARDWNFVMQKQVSMGLNLYNQQAFVTKRASELLFEGYQDDLIDMARNMPKIGSFDTRIPYDRFGWLYGRNESEDLAGHFNIHTGKGDIMQLGKTQRWNYQANTGYYPNECGAVRGSGGEFYPPGQTQDEPLSMFSGELCRYLDLYFTEEQVIHGLKVNKYAATERSVDNGTEYSEYACFSDGEVLPSGLMNISACRYGAPVFVSFPHFYAADPYYLDLVDGVNPEKEKHEFYLTLDPETGIPVDVAARLQINVMVRPSPNIALFQEAPTLFFPAMWFEQKVQVPKEMIDDVKIAASIPTIGFISLGVIIVVGLILVIWSGCQRAKSKAISKQQMRKEALHGKNTIEVDKFLAKMPEESPLMKEKTLFGDVKIQRFNEKQKPSAPLAQAENDTEYIEHESIMTPIN